MIDRVAELVGAVAPLILAAAGAALLAPSAPAAILWPTAPTNGAQHDGDVKAIVLSPSATLAVFSADSTNAVPGRNGKRQVYGRALGKTSVGAARILTRRGAALGNLDSDQSDVNAALGLDVSADGRYVVFESQARNLVPGFQDGNGNGYDIFVLDRSTGAITLVSKARTGPKSSNGDSKGGRISGDGRYVVFQSSSSDLVASPAINAHVPQVFVRDLVAKTTRMVSVNRLGKASNPFSEHGDISADGRYVVFATDDPDMTTGDVNGFRDVFRKSLVTGQVVRVSRRVAGQTNEAGGSDFPTISGDGRYVAFESDAKLVPGDAGNKDVYRRDLRPGHATTTLVSLRKDGQQFGSDANRPSIDADGTRIVFTTAGNDAGSGDTNNQVDVYVRNLVSKHSLWVSQTAGGMPSGGDSTGRTASARE